MIKGEYQLIPSTIDQLPEIAKDPHAVVVYDNFNFKNSVRDQAMGFSCFVMHNLMSAIIVVPPFLPEGGLLQSMLNVSKLVCLEDIIKSVGITRDETSVQILSYFITHMIATVHLSAVKSVFHRSNSMPSMPVVDCLQPSAMFSAIFYNKGTIEGTCNIHKKVQLKKLARLISLKIQHGVVDIYSVFPIVHTLVTHLSILDMASLSECLHSKRKKRISARLNSSSRIFNKNSVFNVMISTQPSCKDTPSMVLRRPERDEP
ncbi:uncharacterized protein CIMG_12157 [Coccidioides immitis RS]|uniref:Uncharacterized protein n=1 Tax=Coccidioides immitis (strain RS) TaxID=246410 RepID=J3K5D1_COCIM|nr:uncharacterized protein CIMG_12157 [Coccidioides immitis RS]EAS29627.3 hypothetical protein CIMG_12157 [Coccidioides immitis RS]